MPLEEDGIDDGLPTEPENSISDIAEAPEEGSVEEETPVEPDPAVEESADEPPGLSDLLVREAKDRYGFTDDDIQSFGTDDDLSRQLGAIDRMSLQRVAQQQTGQQQPPQAQPGPEKWAPEKLELTISDDFEPEVSELLSKINDHHHEQLLKQQQQMEERLWGLDEFTAGVQQQQMAAYEKQLDDYFDTLPEEYEAIFGKGPTSALPQHSQARQNRLGWEQDYQSHMQVDYQAGRPIAAFDEYKGRVTRARWGNQGDKAVKREVRTQAAQQRRKAINRPSSRKTKAASGTERAADFANQFYRERGEDLYSGQNLSNQDV